MGGFYKLNTESLLCASAGMMADHIFFSRPLLKLCNIIVRCISKKQLKSVCSGVYCLLALSTVEMHLLNFERVCLYL